MLLNQFGQYLNMRTQLFTLPSNKKLGPLIVLGIDSHCTFPSRKSLTIVQKQAPLITAIIEQKKAKWFKWELVFAQKCWAMWQIVKQILPVVQGIATDTCEISLESNLGDLRYFQVLCIVLFPKP